MKFNIEYSNNIEHRLLTYIVEEYSFDMNPIVNKIDFELILNTLCLSVVNNKIIQLWGLCGLGKQMKSNYNVPAYSRGFFKVEDNLKFGFAYDIRDGDFPVYVNVKTGWVCIGNPEENGNAVEFIDKCIAVIDNSGEFISLWLHPQSLPII